MTENTPDTGPTRPQSGALPIGAIISIVVLAAAGLALLGYALTGLFGASTNATPVAQATRSAATQLVIIPTITTGPPASSTPLPPSPTAASADSPTPPAPTQSAATVTPSGPAVTILQPANVRSGPGINYSVIGILDAGSTQEAVGRDDSAQWYVINYGGGRGWVSSHISNYSGDTNALPVVKAPPPPFTSTNTPVPATATPRGYNSRGVVPSRFWVEQTNVAVNEKVWFNFLVNNTTNENIAYSVLAARAENGPAKDSWTNETLKPGFGPAGSTPWRDWIAFSAPGTYQLYLGICYGGRDPCLALQAPWDRLSDNVTITVR